MNDNPAYSATDMLRAKGPIAASVELRNKYKRGAIEPHYFESLGRHYKKHIDEYAVSFNSGSTERILILAQFTSTWLADAIHGLGFLEGKSLIVEEGAYNSIMQEVFQLKDSSLLPDTVILCPWYAMHWHDGKGKQQESIESAFHFWSEVWALLKSFKDIKIVQLGYDWDSIDASGYHLSWKEGLVGWIRELNVKIRAGLPDGSYFVDLETIASSHGKTEFYDRRRQLLTKQPFSEMAIGHIAKHILRAHTLLNGEVYKVLVTDLDDTLWEGTVAEEGPLGIGIDNDAEGEAFLHYQRYLKALSDQGVLLAVVSKNNEKDAREPFEKNPRMALRYDDFSAFIANWEPKSLNIQRIAKQLGLGMNSFVFVDDSPAEREEVLQNAPDVRVVPISDDPADRVAMIQEGLWFESFGGTSEDSVRKNQYHEEASRQRTQSHFKSLDEYLSSLDMQAAFEPINESNIQRVAQLMGKTNQFNLTTRRYSLGRIREWMENPEMTSLVMSMSDKFGDYGTVAVVLAVPGKMKRSLYLDAWLMSCRVINRTAEYCMLREFSQLAADKGILHLIGEYIPTAKNQLVADFYKNCGFRDMAVSNERQKVFVLNLGEKHELPPTFLSLKLKHEGHS